MIVIDGPGGGERMCKASDASKNFAKRFLVIHMRAQPSQMPSSMRAAYQCVSLPVCAAIPA